MLVDTSSVRIAPHSLTWADLTKDPDYERSRLGSRALCWGEGFFLWSKTILPGLMGDRYRGNTPHLAPKKKIGIFTRIKRIGLEALSLQRKEEKPTSGFSRRQVFRISAISDVE